MLGKTENRGGSVSNPLEEQKTRKIALPTPWKNEKCSQEHFQPLGKRKQTAGNISNPLESVNRLLATFPTPWKRKKILYSFSQHKGNME